MSSINSIGKLEDALQRDLGWRRKEIASLYLDVVGTTGDSQSRAIRSGILLAYAHLEGFVRMAARSYLSYVKERNMTYRELAPNFLALTVSRLVSEATTKASYYHNVVELLVAKLDEAAVLPNPEVISAKSNLSYSQFSEILFCINIDVSPFSLKENFIDEVLLEKRNGIAHGELRKPTVDDFIEIHDGVWDLLSKFEESVVAAAVGEGYKSTGVPLIP